MSMSTFILNSKFMHNIFLNFSSIFFRIHCDILYSILYMRNFLLHSSQNTTSTNQRETLLG